MAAINGTALCVGVSKYNDRELVALPDAAASAREIQKAFDTKLLPTTATIVDPGSNGDLFLRLQKAAGEARGGTFVLYFAGHALRRGGDLLLATRDTELEGTRGCVPWSDVRDMLKREGVATGLVLLNVDQPAGSGRPQLTGGSVAVMGSIRTYDAGTANATLRAYSDAVLAVLQKPAAEIAAFLHDDILDAGGLHKYLAAKAPPTAAHASFSTPARAAVLREFTPAAAVSMRGSALPPAPKPAAAPPAAAAPPPAAAPAPEPASPPEPAPAPAPAPEPAPAPPAAAAAAPPVPAPTPEPQPEPAPDPAPAPEPEPAPEPAAAAAPEPVPEPAPEPAPAPAPARAPAPIERAAARPASNLTYVLLAAAAVVAAVVYALLR